MYRWNNFHEYFPGGANRKNNNNPKLMSDLDAVLPQIGFDIGRFYELIGRKRQLLAETVTLFKKQRAEKRDPTPEESQREKELETGTDETWGALDKLLEPAYNKMVERGWSSGDLHG